MLINANTNIDKQFEGKVDPLIAKIQKRAIRLTVMMMNQERKDYNENVDQEYDRSWNISMIDEE